MRFDALVCAYGVRTARGARGVGVIRRPVERGVAPRALRAESLLRAEKREDEGALSPPTVAWWSGSGGGVGRREGGDVRRSRRLSEPSALRCDSRSVSRASAFSKRSRKPVPAPSGRASRSGLARGRPLVWAEGGALPEAAWCTPGVAAAVAIE